jgi:hypothetical protein
MDTYDNETYDNDENDCIASVDRNKFSNKISRSKRAYYTSNIADTYIKNALTGEVYAYKVGSYDSKRLFKVVDTLGLHDKDGRKFEMSKRRGEHKQINSNPNHLFYDSPEEYMKHQHTTVQPEFIERWRETRNRLFPICVQ